jgi:hypothetical protein
MARSQILIDQRAATCFPRNARRTVNRARSRLGRKNKMIEQLADNVASQRELVQFYSDKAAKAQDPDKAASFRRCAEVIESWSPEDADFIARDFTRLLGG